MPISTATAAQAPIAALASGASTSDILTTLKNIVTALNAATQAYLDVNGQSDYANISAATVVKASPGRVASVSITTAGSASGVIYDGATTGATSRPVWIIPNTVGEAFVNFPMSYGILVVPGSGQVVAVSYS